ncbi:hypothetical protein [Rhizobium leguminosarum]|uniref:hypothetical protein n=1 Tax=Rhizobium leguminosarum TaxID=384 RepID=UPI0014423B64|nr:hypothetical protein [Rhizobium leguminosarum]NKL60314.1 hypothetical protein [Rhizobium leguminosarum bv. viciae]
MIQLLPPASSRRSAVLPFFQPSPLLRAGPATCKASNRMMALQGTLLRCQDGPQGSTVDQVTVMDDERHDRHCYLGP